MSSKIDKNKLKAIEELLKLDIKTAKELMKIKRFLARKYGISILLNNEILGIYKNKITKKEVVEDRNFMSLLKKRAIRTMSGIAPVAVLTKPYDCPGRCAYCPTEKDVPQSYLSNEPAVMRAIRCGYNPYIQVQDRLKALIVNGHEPTKIELIVIGGTWSVLPDKYKYWYILNCFAAANDFRENKKVDIERYKITLSLEELREALMREQKKNEKAKYKIVGLTLETRPDYINKNEVWQMRELGCTRVELGVQHTSDDILKKNKRGHGVLEIAYAVKLLRDFGFKITFHLMPGLPGSTPTEDRKMYEELFSDERFQPDQIKFYPTVVTRGSLLYRWWKSNKYRPYSDSVLQKLIIDCKKKTPPYVRIIRLIRDIPGESIIAGNKITNLRQIMKDKGVICNCIRCRESKDKTIKDYELKIKNYKAADGQEYFISFESKDGKTLYGFARLRLPGKNLMVDKFLQDTAFIRELHVYGELVSVGSTKKTQHTGLGKKLLKHAEEIAHENGFKKMTIISGVGVRDYYRKLGYKLSNSYMIKKI